MIAVVGDVSGKGMPAALIMSRATSSFRRLARASASPHALLAQLNHALVEQFPDDSFVTVACVQLDAAGRCGVVANAGHALPLMRRGGAVTPLGWASGPPLGMLPGQSYIGEQFELCPGDIVILMTDGVSEALNPARDPLELRALLRLVAEAPRDLDEIHRRILAAIDAATDDVTLLSLELVGHA
jgi:sigma-B regulation protein RsbU (phosphoserine phosphatase)